MQPSQPYARQEDTDKVTSHQIGETDSGSGTSQAERSGNTNQRKQTFDAKRGSRLSSDVFDTANGAHSAVARSGGLIDRRVKRVTLFDQIARHLKTTLNIFHGQYSLANTV